MSGKGFESERIFPLIESFYRFTGRMMVRFPPGPHLRMVFSMLLPTDYGGFEKGPWESKQILSLGKWQSHHM
jgi:hypothetical protein